MENFEKFRIYSFVSLYFYTVNLDEDIAPESFSLKINLRSLW